MTEVVDDTREVMIEAHRLHGVGKYHALRPDDHIHDCADCRRVLLAPGTAAGRKVGEVPPSVSAWVRDRRWPGHVRPVCKGCWAKRGLP
jgi:hypothetical protein